jgi:hypothetical protein
VPPMDLGMDEFAQFQIGPIDLGILGDIRGTSGHEKADGQPDVTYTSSLPTFADQYSQFASSMEVEMPITGLALNDVLGSTFNFVYSLPSSPMPWTDFISGNAQSLQTHDIKVNPACLNSLSIFELDSMDVHGNNSGYSDSVMFGSSNPPIGYMDNPLLNDTLCQIHGNDFASTGKGILIDSGPDQALCSGPTSTFKTTYPVTDPGRHCTFEH